MVITRSQSLKTYQFESISMENCGHSGSNANFPEFLSRDITNDIDKMNMVDQEREHERIRNYQRFLEMNIQIRYLMTFDKALAEQMNSGREYT